MAKERFFLELTPPDATLRPLPHVVIVGGGFAGLRAAHVLIGKPVRVTLIETYGDAPFGGGESNFSTAFELRQEDGAWRFSQS